MTEDSQSFFRRWRVAILLGVPLVAVLVVVREFIDHRSNSPIVEPYLAVINEISLHSPLARQRLEQYYAKHQRQTVASQHYPWLCKEMQELAAQEDGITLVRRRPGPDVLWLPDQKSVEIGCPLPFNIYEKP
jgi:hypothetical protein